MTPVMLRCEGLRVGYAGKALLPAVDLEVRQGESWVVLGRNGAGKTTLFRSLLGLLPPVSGRVERAEGIELAYLAQRIDFDDLYPVRVRDLVGHGTIRGWSFLDPFGGRGDRIDRALAAVGIAELGQRTFRSLSGGQQQRALFARMLASGARLVLLDEPTQGMDAVATREVLDLLVRLREEYKLTMVVVTHDLAVAREQADHVLFLGGPERVLGGPAAEVMADPTFVAQYGSALAGVC